MSIPQPPWFFCCGWWSPWCLLDEYAHRLGLSLRVEDVDNPDHADWWLCRKHDTAVHRYHEHQEDRP